MGENLATLSDADIVARARHGSDEATDYLLTKYRALVKREARTMFLIGADSEDLIQEGMIGLFKAIRDFQFDQETSFHSFAKLCIDRQIYSAVTAYTRKKHGPLNTYISLNSPVFDANKGLELKDTLRAASEESDPERLMLSKERFLDIELKMVEKLSEFERKVLQLYLDGIRYGEIAQQLNKPTKAIDNAIQRIRKKLIE